MIVPCELTVTGGRRAVIKLRYAETLVRNPPGSRRLQKGNRNDIEGKDFIGYHDEFIALPRKETRLRT